MYIPHYNYKKIGIACVVLFIYGILFTYVIFPPILRKILISQVWLKPGSQMREMYDELPFPLIFKVFVFNVTNRDEVAAGGKPALQEIGPFVFEEYKIRIDQIDDKDEDTLEYNLINTFIFNERLSNGLTGNEIITMPHPLLTLMALNTNRERHALLPLVSAAIKQIFHNPKDAFWSGKVIDILFHGIDIDCSSDDYNSKAACNVFESGDVKSIQKPLNYPEHHYLFSLFGSGNGTDAGRYKVYRGIKNISDLGRIISVDDESETDAWSGDECNQIHGTDATIFPPFMSKEEGLWAFEPAICRSMKAVYEKPSKYSGLPTLRYKLDLGDIRADEQLHCFCDDENDIETCPLKGTMDIFKCADAALIVSLPHFYNADESLLKNIKSGLNPSKEHHEMFIDFEIISGTAVSGAKRVQINLDMKPVDKVDSMLTLPEMLFPLLWIEEGVNLNKTYVNMLKYQLFLALKFQATMKYLCLIGGSLGGAISAILHYKRTQQVTVMKPLEIDNNNNNNSGEVLNEIEINNIKNINLSKNNNNNNGSNANSINDNNNNNNNNENIINLNIAKHLNKHQIIQKY